MATKPKPDIRNSSGKKLKLTTLLAEGGEGTIFDVESHPDLVAKIYHKPITREKSEKLASMAAIKDSRLLSLTAWPSDILKSPLDNVCGFLMPKIVGHKDIHHLYSPRGRKQEFPNADWRFLIRTASNVAKSFAVIHDAGFVIGDVNHGSITVSNRATVRLIDCDSMQIAIGSRKFLCEVGMPTFTPPELQNRPFRGIERTPNHDSFGLAVIIFHLLFMGRHPFAGRFFGQGEMPIERAIQEFRFAYGTDRSAAKMESPPGAPQLNAVSKTVSDLIERAFAKDGVHGNRPSAKEWAAALDALENSVRLCSVNSAHHYFSGAPACPWCQIERTTGTTLFNFYFSAPAGSTTFDLGAIWARVTAISSPGPAPVSSLASHLNIKPSAEAQEHAGGGWHNGGVLVLALAGFITGTAMASKQWLIWAIIAVVAYFVFRKKPSSEVIRKFQAIHRSADARASQAKDIWNRTAGDARFVEALKKLELARVQLIDLPNERLRRLRKLEQEREMLQRRRYLEKFEIEFAKIPGIGPGKKAMLESYSIETAWDVTPSKITMVPGFGPKNTKKMTDWRRSVEARFRFDPAQPINPKDIADVEQEILALKQNLQTALAGGPAQLTQIKTHIMSQRAALREQLEDALQALAQATADMNAVQK